MTNIQTNDQASAQKLLSYYLSDECDQVFDYDNLYAELANEDGESFDLFVRLSYELSEMKLTIDQIKRASSMIARLAQHTLQFNFAQLDHTDEEIEACA